MSACSNLVLLRFTIIIAKKIRKEKSCKFISIILYSYTVDISSVSTLRKKFVIYNVKYLITKIMFAVNFKNGFCYFNSIPTFKKKTF